MEDASKLLSEVIASAEKECGLDWRFSYAKLSARGEGMFDIELSREEMWRAIPRLLEGFSVREESQRRVALAAAGGLVVTLTLLEADRRRPLWTISSVADVRREGAHSAELLTQLIMGDEALALKTVGDWHLVMLPDGYHGWIRSWCVRGTDAAEIAAYAKAARAVVDANVGYVVAEPDEGSLPVSEVVAGTRLAAGTEAGAYRAVTLPGGREGFVPSGILSFGEGPAVPDRRRLVGRAMRFVGIPYLWGGTTAKGFDCSGLVKRVFLMEGLSLPRDSDRQALVGDLVPRDEVDRLEPGDLLFFGEGGKVGHVAISLGERLFIHAYGEVRLGSLSPTDSRYDERFAKIFLFARSILRRAGRGR
jgi:hypothetical protein